ncbi:phage tail protein [Agrobacterium tumefaciens]|uniref:phage tail tube protein n=1 Tax=Agrobacterium tumefaciens TaxID=358 RepID=UPI0021D1514D|nr:phage tail tube protein [Agrobacterium tumefaciens]UXT47842.1 phage tail protein [Agrobacterium tumefaciens]
MALGRTLTVARSDEADGFDLACVTEQRTLTINNEQIDITKPDCANPGSKLVRTLEYGVQSIDFSGQGAFVNTATMQAVVQDAVQQRKRVYQVSVPEVGTFEGDALLNVTFSGDKTNELQAEISLAMSGVILFVAAA